MIKKIINVFSPKTKSVETAISSEREHQIRTEVHAYATGIDFALRQPVAQ